MQKWVEDKLAFLKFLINRPRKPRTKKNPGDETASKVDETESIGTVDDDDDDFEENLEDDDEDERDSDDSDEEDNEEEKEEMAQDVYHYPVIYQREIDALKTEESLPKKKLDRRNRWSADADREDLIERAEISETLDCLPSTSASVMERDADKKDICTNLMAESCQGKRCDKHHTVLPYLWQVRIFGSWVSFNDQENQNIEKSYCSLAEIQDAEVDHDGRKYKIHMKFNENTGVVYEIMHGNESLNTNDILSIRRLSTASLAKEKKPLTTGSFHTQWRWHFQDDSGQWILFDKERFQYTLEKKYVMGQKTYLFTRESYRFKYRIEFADWKQINIDTGKERRILRRPLFVSITDVTSKSYPQILAVPAPGPKPPGWEPWDLAHDFELVDLEESSNEYKIVKSSIFDTLKEDCFQVCNIYRIQNLGLWNEYKMKKTNMEREKEIRGGDVNEKHLFHGTDSIDTCYGICTNNFDFRLSGKNATMYGKGSYFASTAKYSNCYTRGPVRLIFRAKILIGQYTKGEKDIVCPPNIPGAGHKRYDSCVDDENNPTVFVVFDRNQSYPEHLIAYKEKEDDLRPTLSGPNTGSAGRVQTVQASVSSARSSTVQPSYRAGASSGATQPTSHQRPSYNNPYAPSPGILTSPPSATSEGFQGSQSLSYRTAAGREERMFYPEPKKKDESCSVQ